MDANLELYLKATATIDADHGRIRETAGDITQGCSNDEERAVKLFYFVRDEIRYNVYMVSVFLGDFKASRVLEWGKGYCVQKAVLLCALGRAAHIPSRLAFARIQNHRLPDHVRETLGTAIFPRHGYNQFFLNGRWVSATAAFDKDLCEKSGLPTVEFNGKEDALLPEKTLKGESYIEYLKKYAPTEDLPFDWIVRKISDMVGPDKRSWLNRDRGPDQETIF